MAKPLHYHEDLCYLALDFAAKLQLVRALVRDTRDQAALFDGITGRGNLVSGARRAGSGGERLRQT